MPSEKHQQQAREILSDFAGSPHPLQDIIAAALEAAEREYQAENSQLREQLAEERARLTQLANLIEESAGHEITIARRQDGQVYIAEFKGDGAWGGGDLEEAIDKARAGKGEADAAQAQH